MHPIVVDRTLLWALGVLYGLYALWGIASFLIRKSRHRVEQ